MAKTPHKPIDSTQESVQHPVPQASTVQTRPKLLVLSGSTNPSRNPIIESLIAAAGGGYEVVEAATFEDAVAALRDQDFSGVFSEASDFLPLERAVMTQQASIVLNTIGEGVCIVDCEGRANWMNQKMRAWPPHVREQVRRTCHEAFETFLKASQTSDVTGVSLLRSRRYSITLDNLSLELVVSPVVSNGGRILQLVCVVWDVTGTRRLQSKIDAIDRAGRELVKLESEAMRSLTVGDRLKMLEEKIIKSTRELMHFDHFAIRLLNRKTGKLELVMSAGLPPDALNVELFAKSDNNGISGYVAATGQSYICVDVTADSRYVAGLDQAMSSLTVPLTLNDKVIGIFNVESVQRGAFSEDDRQFAEIFGRYVAMALNILDLLVTERIQTSHKIADDVCAELAGPLNDLTIDIRSFKEEYVHDAEVNLKLESILANVAFIQKHLRQTAEGPNTTILGMNQLKTPEADAVLMDARILVADDEKNIRDTLGDILRKYKVHVTTAADGEQAIAALNDVEQPLFDVVISDINMPGKTGYDVFTAAKGQQKPPQVILMTGFGYDPSHAIVRASQNGLSGVLFKPFRVQMLLDEVRKALVTHRKPIAESHDKTSDDDDSDNAPGS